MVKLLSAPDPAPAIAVMRQTGVMSTVLPGSDDRLLPLLVHMETAVGLDADWIRRLAVLGGDDPAEKFRLSKADSRILLLIREVGFVGASIEEIAYRHGARVAQGAMLIRAALAETEPDDSLLEVIEDAVHAKFPISASDLMPDLKGPELGQKLKELEQRWITSGFTLGADELLNRP